MPSLPCFRAIVLLSAYGASPYLSAQVASITAQLTEQDLLILVDDGSRAVCWEVLKPVLPTNYLCWSRLQGQGFSASFLDLLLTSAPKGQYYFLADQDDVWLPEKLNRQLAATPTDGMSVHGWQVWDMTTPPDTENAQKPVYALSAAHYFFETPAPGMTMCFGQECRAQLQHWTAVLAPFTAGLPHDRILAAAVSTVGSVVVLATPGVWYRQHGGNQIGAPGKGALARFWQRLRQVQSSWRSIHTGLSLYWALSALGAKLPAAPWRLPLRSGILDNWMVRCLVYFTTISRKQLH